MFVCSHNSDIFTQFHHLTKIRLFIILDLIWVLEYLYVDGKEENNGSALIKRFLNETVVFVDNQIPLIVVSNLKKLKVMKYLSVSLF